MNPVFRLKDVHFAYLNRFPAINGVSMDVTAAARVALIGSNGSGKSSLLRLLDALYFPQSGSVEFEGEVISEARLSDEAYEYGFRRKVGFLFQDPETQLFSSTVWDEICFGPLQLQWEKERIRDSAEKILEQFAIKHLRDRPPHRLSIGEKKKVALASVLVVDPEVLLLDEPTASLDPRTQSVLLELLHDWSRRNKTIITSTHDLAILPEICNEVFVMNVGKIVCHDAPEKVLANEALLDETNLIHIHTHKHRDVEHAHPHTHDFHAHPHGHEEKDEG